MFLFHLFSSSFQNSLFTSGCAEFVAEINFFQLQKAGTTLAGCAGLSLRWSSSLFVGHWCLGIAVVDACYSGSRGEVSEAVAPGLVVSSGMWLPMRDWKLVSCIAGGFFAIESLGKFLFRFLNFFQWFFCSFMIIFFAPFVFPKLVLKIPCFMFAFHFNYMFSHTEKNLEIKLIFIFAVYSNYAKLICLL